GHGTDRLPARRGLLPPVRGWGNARSQTNVKSRVERPGAEIEGRRGRTPPGVKKLVATRRRLTLISLCDSLPAKTRGIRGWGRRVPGRQGNAVFETIGDADGGHSRGRKLEAEKRGSIPKKERLRRSAPGQNLCVSARGEIPLGMAGIQGEKAAEV